MADPTSSAPGPEKNGLLSELAKLAGDYTTDKVRTGRKNVWNGIITLIIGWLFAYAAAYWWWDSRAVPGAIYFVGVWVIWYYATEITAIISSALAGFGVRSAQRTEEEQPDRSKGLIDGVRFFFHEFVFGGQYVWGLLMLPLVVFEHDVQGAYWAFVLAAHFSFVFVQYLDNKLLKTILWILVGGVLVVNAWNVLPLHMPRDSFDQFTGQALGMMDVLETNEKGDIVVVRLYSEISPDNCRPAGVVHVGFDYAKDSLCYSQTSGNKLVPWTHEAIQLDKVGNLSLSAAKKHIKNFFSLEWLPGRGRSSASVAPAAATPVREYCDDDIGPVGDNLVSCWLEAGEEIKLSVSYAHCPYSVSGVEFFDHDGFGNWRARLEEGPREFKAEIGSLAAGTTLTIRGKTLHCPDMSDD